LYQRTSNSLRRLLEAVGLERRARDITPNLRDYLKATEATGTAKPNGHNTAHPEAADAAAQTLRSRQDGDGDGEQ